MPFIIRTPFKVFGWEGVAWFVPFFIIVWRGADDEIELHELVHYRQWQECALIGAAIGLGISAMSAFPLLIVLPVAVLIAFVVLYGLIWLPYAVFTDNAHDYHPMEQDARDHAGTAFQARSRFTWFGYLIEDISALL